MGDAVAFALQGNMFAGAHEVDMPEQLARGSAESLSYNLILGEIVVIIIEGS